MRTSDNSNRNDRSTLPHVGPHRHVTVRHFTRPPFEAETVHLHVSSLEGDVFGRVLLALDAIGDFALGQSPRLQERLQISTGPVDEVALAA
jgi:hypothetical protein